MDSEVRAVTWKQLFHSLKVASLLLLLNVKEKIKLVLPVCHHLDVCRL